MRSPYLHEFNNQLSELNNHLSHYIFVWEQFHIDNKEKIDQNKSKLTTEVYLNNEYSPQFRVQLNELENSNEETNSFILRSLFLLAYSQFEIYMRNFYEFARKTNEDLPNLKVKERIPDKIFEYLSIEIDKIFSEEEILTFDYLRLRRNRIIHSGEKSQGDLAKLKRQKGKSLQRFWNKTMRKGLNRLDFQSEEIIHFKKEEIFDIINIYRKLLKKIDAVIIDNIGKPEIIEALRIKFENDNKNNLKGWGSKRANRKFKSFCRFEFDYNISLNEFENIKVE